MAPLVDQLPATGPVPESIVKEIFTYGRSLPRVGVGIITKFLTVKRPDLFLPTNNANRRRIKQLFGGFPTGVDDYLELLGKIYLFPWYRCERPVDGLEAEIWDARVGLLDAVVYEPSADD